MISCCRQTFFQQGFRFRRGSVLIPFLMCGDVLICLYEDVGASTNITRRDLCTLLAPFSNNYNEWIDISTPLHGALRSPKLFLIYKLRFSANPKSLTTNKCKKKLHTKKLHARRGKQEGTGNIFSHQPSTQHTTRTTTLFFSYSHLVLPIAHPTRPTLYTFTQL